MKTESKTTIDDIEAQTPSGAGLGAPPCSAVFDIANPSDPYTIKGPFMACAIAVAILGNGAYGINGTPVLFGWNDWLKEHGIMDLEAHIEAHKPEIIDALDSVLIGDERDREEVEATLVRLPKEQHSAWLAERHDRRRSSMNNIGAKAERLAARLRSEQNDRHEPMRSPKQ
jgi:hypothetical protein